MTAVRFVALFVNILGSVTGLFLDSLHRDRNWPLFFATGNSDEMR